jgi:antirestriction protein
MYLNIFITNLGKYTEGFLVGEWVSLPCDDLQAVYKRIGIDGVRYEEMFITDYETDIDSLEIKEYSNIKDLNEKMEALTILSDDEIEAFQAFLYHGYDFEDAIEHAQNGDFAYYPNCDDASDIAYYIVNESGMYDNLPGNLSFYIDYEAMGRDINIESHLYFINGGCYELLA